MANLENLVTLDQDNLNHIPCPKLFCATSLNNENFEPETIRFYRISSQQQNLILLLIKSFAFLFIKKRLKKAHVKKNNVKIQDYRPEIMSTINSYK